MASAVDILALNHPHICTIRWGEHSANRIHGKLDGKSCAEAARSADYSETVARRGGPRLHGVIEAFLESAGITDELLGKRMFEGLNATVVSKETAYAKREELVNFTERREMVGLILRFRGFLTDRHQVDVGPTLAELIEESYRV
jgi:hypothetical protein